MSVPSPSQQTDLPSSVPVTPTVSGSLSQVMKSFSSSPSVNASSVGPPAVRLSLATSFMSHTGNVSHSTWSCNQQLDSIVDPGIHSTASAAHEKVLHFRLFSLFWRRSKSLLQSTLMQENHGDFLSAALDVFHETFPTAESFATQLQITNAGNHTVYDLDGADADNFDLYQLTADITNFAGRDDEAAPMSLIINLPYKFEATLRSLFQDFRCSVPRSITTRSSRAKSVSSNHSSTHDDAASTLSTYGPTSVAAPSSLASKKSDKRGSMKRIGNSPIPSSAPDDVDSKPPATTTADMDYVHSTNVDLNSNSVGDSMRSASPGLVSPSAIEHSSSSAQVRAAVDASLAQMKRYHARKADHATDDESLTHLQHGVSRSGLSRVSPVALYGASLPQSPTTSTGTMPPLISPTQATPVTGTTDWLSVLATTDRTPTSTNAVPSTVSNSTFPVVNSTLKPPPVPAPGLPTTLPGAPPVCAVTAPPPPDHLPPPPASAIPAATTTTEASAYQSGVVDDGSTIVDDGHTVIDDDYTIVDDDDTSTVDTGVSFQGHPVSPSLGRPIGSRRLGSRPGRISRPGRGTPGRHSTDLGLHHSSTGSLLPTASLDSSLGRTCDDADPSCADAGREVNSGNDSHHSGRAVTSVVAPLSSTEHCRVGSNSLYGPSSENDPHSSRYQATPFELCANQHPDLSRFDPGRDPSRSDYGRGASFQPSHLQRRDGSTVPVHPTPHFPVDRDVASAPLPPSGVRDPSTAVHGHDPLAGDWQAYPPSASRATTLAHRQRHPWQHKLLDVCVQDSPLSSSWEADHADEGTIVCYPISIYPQEHGADAVNNIDSFKRHWNQAQPPTESYSTHRYLYLVVAPYKTGTCLLSWLMTFTAACQSQNIYAPHPHTMTVGSLYGLWFHELPHWIQSTVGLYAPMILNLLCNHKTGVGDDATLLNMVTTAPCGYTALQLLAQAGRHPRFIDDPVLRFPMQLDNESLSVYIQRAIGHARVCYLDRRLLSQRFFYGQLLRHMDATVRLLLGQIFALGYRAAFPDDRASRHPINGLSLTVRRLCERAGQTVCYGSTPRALKAARRVNSRPVPVSARGSSYPFRASRAPLTGTTVHALTTDEPSDDNSLPDPRLSVADDASNALADALTLPTANPGDGLVHALGADATCYLCGAAGHVIGSGCPRFQALRANEHQMITVRRALRDRPHIRALSIDADPTDLLGFDTFADELLGSDFH